MVGQCANATCTAIFRSLHQGKLFVFPRQKISGADEQPAITYVWLCEACSRTMAAAFVDGQIQLVPTKPFEFERFAVDGTGLWVSICRTCHAFVAAAADELLLAIPEGVHLCAHGKKKPPASVRFRGLNAGLNDTVGH